MSYLRMYDGPKKERQQRRELNTLQQQQETRSLVVPTIDHTSDNVVIATIAPSKPMERKPNRLFVVCKCIVGLAITIAAITELGMYVLNASRQISSNLPAILAEVEKCIPVCRDVYCYLFLMGMPGIGRHLWSQGKYLASVCCWIFVACLFYYGILINVQWTSTTSSIATMDKEAKLNEALIANPKTKLLADTYNKAVSDEKEFAAKEKAECAIWDSTRCRTFNRQLIVYRKAVEIATPPYQRALENASTEASQKASPEKADTANLIRWATFGFVKPSENDIAMQQLFFRTTIALFVGVVLALLL
jgi:hypothetical protein